MRRFAAILAVAALLAPRAAHAAAQAAPGPEANQAFLAANAKKPGVITLPNGLQYRVLQNGLGRRVAADDMVQIQFSAKLIDGTLFDGTSPGLPATMQASGVLRGLSEALQHMHVGDRWQIVLPPALGFGAAGSRGGIVPPDQALVFDVTVAAILTASQSAQQAQDPLSLLSADGGRKAVLTIRP